MDDILHIKWDTGYMNICMRMFFPCSAAKYNKLLKVIQMDIHAEEILSEMKRFFHERVLELEQEYQTSGRLYWDFQQKEADTKRMIESRKRPNGVPLNKDELKEAKAGLKDLTSLKRMYERGAIEAKKHKEWFMQKEVS